MEFAAPREFAGGDSKGVLSVDTSDKGTVAAGCGTGSRPDLRADMEAMVQELRVEMLHDLAEVRGKQDDQADGLNDGVIGLGSLQQELEDLRVRQRARQAVGGGHVQPEKEALARDLSGELTALTVSFES
eukprot:scaffold11799_cov32-Attheya_sp.AAC.2